MSEDAATWIAGFLSGTEAELYEYLGIQCVDPRLGIEPTEAEEARWLQFNARYRATGYCPELDGRPLVPLTLTEAERAELRITGELRPWAFVGERVWVPSDDIWVEADPQPDLVDGELANTVCARRHYSETIGLENGWSICLDCAKIRVI